MKEIAVKIPPSKSHTHRAFLCAALARGKSKIHDPLLSEDTLYTLKAIEALGVSTERRGGTLVIKGGVLRTPRDPLYLGNSGTSLRLLTAICCLVPGSVILTGSERLKQRPVGPLVEALRRWGGKVEDREGFPPVKVSGGGLRGGRTEVDLTLSSQFLSALLLVAPYVREEASIRTLTRGVSRPYVEVTREVMEAFGISVKVERDTYRVPKGTYQGTDYAVPPDPSSATYPLMAGALMGIRVKVLGLSARGNHPDLGFLRLLEAMGAEVKIDSDGVSVRGGDLKGIEMEVADMPDSVPALAVLGAFAQGETVIKGIGHLRYKESDRIQAITQGLTAMGIEVEASEGQLRIKGGRPRPALIDSHNDHRIAMAFAMASLRVPGLMVSNPECVAKSFPDFWQVFSRIKEGL